MFSDSSGPKAKTEQERIEKVKRSPQLKNEGSNPCIKEQDLSYKCLSENNYAKEKCELYFKNYQNCKDFWGKIKTERQRKGIKPSLPPAEERQEYLKARQHSRLPT